MRNFCYLLLLFPLSLFAQKFSTTEIVKFKSQAKQVTIIRDTWGIAHVYGKTDANAVFGLLFAQCEDDFTRVELNYIEKLGRLAEINGEKDLYNDLQIRLLIDTTEAIADYNNAQLWLKKLLNAYADGINYYLYKNPKVKPLLLTKFKPWYALLWTDGSIGAINTADLTVNELKKFYNNDFSKTTAIPVIKEQQSGSNGFAFAPSITQSGNAILYINPHTTFYFRPEIQMQSEEGLNAYGVVTWGQFFIYQGFNEHCGWMHTSNNVDIADIYAEKITKTNKGLFYEYDNKQLPVLQKVISISYRDELVLKTKKFTAYFTNKGPIMASRDGKWISLKSKNRNIQSLIQSWVRTKAKSFNDYKKAMDLKANGSNNTVYADASGNIAYWHGNFIPIRNTKYNWANVVDGSTSATAWKGLHEVKETVHVYNPKNGWLQNCNSTPFSVAGNNSPVKANYPPYMAPDGENFRGINAVRVLSNGSKYTLEQVIAAGYNTYLSAFEVLIPALLTAHQNLPQTDSLKTELNEAITLLKNWNFNAGEESVATTLGVEWAQRLNPIIQKTYINQDEKDQIENTKEFVANATASQLLIPLKNTLANLIQRFGKWQMPWGQVNRYQRLTGAITEKYDDNLPSLPVGFTSVLWGQLPAYKSSQIQTNKRYGFSGNSFVCAVEFGKKIKAKSVMAGGNSGNVNSKHFNDQALMYTKGQFKEVLFYKADVLKQAEKIYKP